MIWVTLDCADMECFANDVVDVYEDDLIGPTPLKSYVPEGWQIIRSKHDGLAIALCPEHAQGTSKW